MPIFGYKRRVVASPEVLEMKTLIDKWREPALAYIQPSQVVPDTSNRSSTGLSVDHVHLLATMMLKDGFRSRDKKGGHDIPVLVRGSRASPISVESLHIWRSVTKDEPDFPRVVCEKDSKEHWFTSLGNGHFMQALNLFDQGVANVFTGDKFMPDPEDAGLLKALGVGVQSIVLKSEMPVDERRRLAILLNRNHDYKWGVDADGVVDVRPEACYNARYTLWDAESKNLDSGALTTRVRLELGLKTSDRSPIPNDRNGMPYPRSKQLEHLELRARSRL